MATYHAPEYNMPPLFIDWPGQPSWISDWQKKTQTW